MATPTEEELLILNSIIYYSAFSSYVAEYGDSSIYNWAKQIDINLIDKNKPGEITKEEFVNIINTIKNNPQVYDNMFISNIENTVANPMGDKQQKVTNATISYGGNLIIVYKGTGGDMEWRDNGEGAYSNVTDTKQQREALDYYERMTALYADGKKIYVTGHSKGGNKAQYVGVLKGSEISHVYSFDGQGFNQAFILKYSELIKNNKNKITNISNEYDFINILLTPIAGERKYIKSTTTFGNLNGKDLGDVIGGAMMHKFGGWHSPYSMFKLNNGELDINEVVEQSDLMKELQELFSYYQMYMDEEDWRFLIYSVMNMMISNNDENYGDSYEMPDGFESRLLSLTKGYIEKNKGINVIEFSAILSSIFGITAIQWAVLYSIVPSETYALVTRDFTIEVKEKLLGIVSEVDEEAWYDVTKWDIFYRVEEVIGNLDFASNAKELDGYYKKLIDIQGVSKEKINQIFDSVYEKDKEYGEKLKDIHTKIKSVNEKLDGISNSFVG